MDVLGTVLLSYSNFISRNEAFLFSVDFEELSPLF